MTKSCPAWEIARDGGEFGTMRYVKATTWVIFAGTFVLLPMSVHAAAPLRASHCSAVRMPRAISVRGTITEGNATGTFERTIDLRSGFSRMLRYNGVQESLTGFDGVEWAFSNGIPSIVDVPPLIPDAAARAFVSRLGWNDARVKPSHVTYENGTLVRTYDLPRMSRVTVTSSSDVRRPIRAAVEADHGVQTTAFSEWRCVGAMNYPFRQTLSEVTGETQTVQVTSVTPAQTASGTFDVPKPQAQGRIEQSGPVPFRYSGKRDRHIIVDAAIGGAAVPLIFDTGGANYFGPQTARKLQLPLSGGSTLTGVGSGSLSAAFARIPSLRIANATLNDEVAIVAPLPWPETAGAPGGITGFEFLAEFLTTIDFPKSTIGFANFGDPPPPGGLRIPLKTEGHFPMVEATVNGVPGWFGVDTGDAHGVTLFKRFADRAGVHADATLPQTTGGGVGGATQFAQSRLRTFSIGGINVADTSVRISDATAGAFASRSLGGNLGNGLFHCFRVTFDYRHRAMWLFSDPATEACLQQM